MNNHTYREQQLIKKSNDLFVAAAIIMMYFAAIMYTGVMVSYFHGWHHLGMMGVVLMFPPVILSLLALFITIKHIS